MAAQSRPAIGGLCVSTEVYLIIFLLVAMLVFTYFYSERAQRRHRADRQANGEQAEADTIEA
jgi:hypothetical protein